MVLIYPMFAMVLLTTIVGTIAFFVRVKSVKTKQVKPRDYRLMNAEKFPETVIKTTRNFNNQFEFPVLFYVACLAYLALGISSAPGLFFSWAFVFLRVVHSAIHITYNHLLHRLVAFWLSVFMVLGLWLDLITKTL